MMCVCVGPLLRVRSCEECLVRTTDALLEPWLLCIECCHQCAWIGGEVEVIWVAVSSSCWWMTVELVLVTCVLIVCVWKAGDLVAMSVESSSW